MTETLRGAIALPSGAPIRGRGLRNPMPAGPEPGYGLYLGTERLRRKHEESLRWTHQWVSWPDFRVPSDGEHTSLAIEHLHVRVHDGQSAEVACGGGIGRTGTVLACLAVLDGLDPATALRWTREHHHRRAVETRGQRRWIERFARRQRPAER